VLEAYTQLVAEGYLSSSQGAPTRVAAAAGIERPPVPAGAFQNRARFELDPYTPDLASFPREAWMRSLRSVTRAAPFEAMGAADPRGLPQLRNELMGYLGRARGAAPEPEHTLICASFTEAFAVLCRVLRARGVEQIALEDPGWAQHRLVAESCGMQPVPIPVDGHGVVVEALDASGCEVVVLTPAHQFPTGVVLSAERRTRLLEWAEERDGLIVEDDYDSELRYDRMPVGAIQGLAPERVCQIGSLSKRLAPGMRLGWLLSPSWLTGDLTYERGVGAGASPAIEQLALADFIARGELDRHLRRMRLRYRARRQLVVDELRGLSLRGASAGLFVLVELPDAVEEEAVVREALGREVSVEALSWHSQLVHCRPALLVGFANSSEPTLRRALGRLRLAIEAIVGGKTSQASIS
jgi:GntR family transcriptional regulator/MocR family aminotransferase